MKKSASSATASPDADTRRRIVLVDDHPITREGVRLLIDQQSDLVVCGEAEDAPAALQLIQRLEPDLAIVDITLAKQSGIELVKNLRAVCPELPILVFSMHDERLYAERALRAGAKGYVMKHEPSSELITAARKVLAGEIYLTPKMRELMLRQLVRSGKDEVVFTIDTLSDREMEVFKLIGNGYSTRQIADRLNLSVKTIDSYREHLKVKLHLDKGADLIRHAIQWARSEGVV